MYIVFRAKARLEPAKSWKECAEFPGKLTGRMLLSLLVTFACSHISRSDLGMTLVEGYVHGDANIRLGSLKRWLPMNHQKLSELLEIEFEAMLPGRKQHDQRYSRIHTAPDYSKFSRQNRETTVGGR